MRIRKEEMKASLLSVAVLGALAAMFAAPMMAYAADPTEDEVALIRRPTNFVEIGAENVSDKSAKFGAYNGLNKRAGYGIGNFSLSGGDAYEGGDGTRRWNVTGSDLGTTSAEFGASMGNQGKWNVGVGYDELRHNLADTYQTPYLGSAGGNSFTLPATFGTAANTRTLSPGQVGAFQTVDIGTTRKNSSFNAGYIIDPRWDVKFEFNHLDQSGSKLMAFGSDRHWVNGTQGAGQAVSILPNPTNYKTDTLNLSLNWVGEKANLTASYFGSFFRDGYDRVTWQTWDTNSVTDTMTTAPSNNFHQLNLAGGYAFSPKTKLSGGFSYARNTQNEFFVPTETMITQPLATSLNGLVITKHADVKLTDQSIKDLTLSAGFKYDNRDNRTPSNIYNFNAIDGGNPANYPNTPLSVKKIQWELAGDYRLNKDQHVRLAYNGEDTRRWCDQYAVNAGYPVGTNCVVATGTKENKVGATYRFKASDDLNLNAGYSFAKRMTDADQSAIAAFRSTNGVFVTGLSANGKVIFGTLVAGQNAGDFIGFHPYLDENRTEQMLKLGANWQATERLSLGFTGRYTDDVYDTTYGWKKGNSWSLNLDATYAYSDTGSISTYVTQQNRYRTRTDLRAIALATSSGPNALNNPAYASDDGQLKDTDFTFGLTAKQSGLMAGKLELLGDLSYTLGKTVYSTQLNWDINNRFRWY